MLAMHREEREWFKKELPDFSAKTEVGVDALLQKLDDLINEHIRNRWVPKIKSHISQKKSQNEAQVKTLGTAPADLSVEKLTEEALKLLAPMSNSFDSIIAEVGQMFQLKDKIEIPGMDSGSHPPWQRQIGSFHKAFSIVKHIQTGLKIRL